MFWKWFLNIYNTIIIILKVMSIVISKKYEENFIYLWWHKSLYFWYFLYDILNKKNLYKLNER